MAINKVILVGNVGQDPRVTTIPSTGKEIASFSLATTDRWKDAKTQEPKSKTEWHRITIYNENLAKYVKKYVRKGMTLYIEGSLETKEYEKDGDRKKYVSVVLQGFNSVLQILDRKDYNGDNLKDDSSFENNSDETIDASEFINDKADDVSDDDIPF